MSGLGRNKINALVDALRQNFLYQTAKPVFASDEDEMPEHVILKMKPRSYALMMQFIAEHGGWDLSPEQRKQVADQHNEKAAEIFKAEDLSGFEMGDLAQAFDDSEGIEELAGMRGRIEAELDARTKEPN